MALSINDFQVVADERNNTADILDKDQMKVEISLPIYTVSFLIGKDGRIIEVNGVNVEARLYGMPNGILSRVVMMVHEENGVYGASFPDFPGAITCTENRAELHDKARDMLLFHTEEETGDENRALVRTLEQLKDDPNFAEDKNGGTVEFLDIVFPD